MDSALRTLLSLSSWAPGGWLCSVAGRGELCLPGSLGIIYILSREASQGNGHVLALTVASHKPHHTLRLAAEGFPIYLAGHLRIKGSRKVIYII